MDYIMEMELSRENMPFILVESCGYEGVRRIAAKVAEDVEKVTGAMPKVVTERELPVGERTQVILCATLGRSPVLEEFVRKGLVDLRGLMAEPQTMGEEQTMDKKQFTGEGRRGKWEVYQIKMIDMRGKDSRREEQEAEGAQNVEGMPDVLKEPVLPWEGIDRVLLICGSDKRGTIYGMFSLSEYIGVSPFCFWGDAEPARRERVILRRDIETTSKEPARLFPWTAREAQMKSWLTCTA